MSITRRQNLAGAIARWLLALLSVRFVRPHSSHPPAPLDDGDLAQRVRLTGEW